MPLIIMSGFPASGKTTRANQLAEHLRANTQLPVHVVNEESLLIARAIGYKDSAAEKMTRGALKAAVERACSSNSVVIADSLNYIKGYRYELYCVARAAGTTHCVVFCDSSEKVCLQLNQQKQPDDQWPEQLLQELVMRYEKPNAKNRWDSPLFTVKPSAELPLQELLDFVQSKQTVTQTMATQYSKIQDTNFLYDLDKTTQEVVTAILEGQKSAMVGDEIAIPNASKKVKLMRQVTLAELRRIRKQYLTLTSQLTSTKTNYNQQVDVYNAFVDYMNTSLNAEK